MSVVVAGLVPMSGVDWPGRLAATVFLQGCPWDCGYCQNPASRDPRTPAAVAWEDVLHFLRRRQGLLDGVVFSGGEATRQPGLGAAMTQVRELGFGVALHTAGAHPAAFSRVLPLVDWVGLDLKALPERYGDVVGVGGRPGRAAWRCLDLALAEQERRPGFAFEVRTTVCPTGPDGSPGRVATVEDAVAVARRCREAGVRSFALQEARSTGVRAEAAAEMDAARGTTAWRERWDGVVADVRDLGFAHLEVRAA